MNNTKNIHEKIFRIDSNKYSIRDICIYLEQYQDTHNFWWYFDSGYYVMTHNFPNKHITNKHQTIERKICDIINFLFSTTHYYDR